MINRRSVPALHRACLHQRNQPGRKKPDGILRPGPLKTDMTAARLHMRSQHRLLYVTALGCIVAIALIVLGISVIYEGWSTIPLYGHLDAKDYIVFVQVLVTFSRSTSSAADWRERDGCGARTAPRERLSIH